MSKVLDEMIELEEDTQKGKYLTFKLGKEMFGIEIRYVTEIIGMQPIAEVPEVPDYVQGIINLRGQIIPLIDVRIKFKKEAKAYHDRTCIIVIDIQNTSIGLIVDEVAEVLSIPDEHIVPPPEYKTGFQNRYIKSIGRVGDEVKLILDCEKILDSNELETLEQVSNKGGE
ncbi:purine-binding chemotaxis protein CheW [Tindallia magadiensis]|uniref:Purine-binding chemotaxis protein CheW n=1 Tax=Tindallia magadiensis TaxID=69895 RepID=A0A1I3FHV8_9FIRM|nr:chemotaxis protein CheW [Tindallia magadiensis]SFI10481.1 purine-binding chemotaxis protein CheW [Tindallia magadiensis]